MLAFARDEGAFVNLEIKNLPTDPDFDSSSGYADRVMATVIESGFPKERLIVQSFWPANLTAAEAALPGVETSFLTLEQANDGGPAFASSMDFEWVSPAWPVGAGYMQSARDAGRRVVPYTLNAEQEVRDAAAIGVDALISDDPLDGPAHPRPQPHGPPAGHPAANGERSTPPTTRASARATRASRSD